MKGIITRTLEIKNMYDNMSEGLRPVFFREGGLSDKSWYTRQIEDGERFHAGLDFRGDWFILYGEDSQNSCELVFCEDETGNMVPAEYTVWNTWDQKTYHKIFRTFSN